jgi:hypothetical protein
MKVPIRAENDPAALPTVGRRMLPTGRRRTVRRPAVAEEIEEIEEKFIIIRTRLGKNC